MTISDQIKKREERRKKESNDFHKRVGDNLRKLRESKNYTQEYLAEILGKKNYSSYGKMESGEIRLNLEDALILSDLYNITIEEILTPSYSKKSTHTPPSEPEPIYKRNTVEVTIKLDGTEVGLIKQIEILQSFNKVLSES